MDIVEHLSRSGKQNLDPRLRPEVTTTCDPSPGLERNLSNSGIQSVRTTTKQTMGAMPIALESLVLGSIAITVCGVCCFVT